MNKLFTKIAALSAGLAMAIGVGVVLSQKGFEKAEAAPSTILTFDFEDEGAHRASGTNNYGVSGNNYSENGIDIALVYADSVTSGTPLNGTANVMARIAKNTTNSPSIIVGPMDLSDYNVTGFSYLAKSPGAFVFTASYSTNGSTWNQGETHTSKTATTTFESSQLSVENPGSFYLKIEISVASSTTSNRDAQIDDIKVIGESTSSAALESISCDNQEVSVASSIDLSGLVTFVPANASNKNLSYAIDEGSEYIDLASGGVVTGKKGGSACVVITPEDQSGGATEIYVDITINPITAPSITVGEQYVVYATDETNGSFELTGFASSYGVATSFSSEVPSCSYVLTAEAGYYENTIAFGNNGQYLALNSAGNNLNSKDTIDANSSWLVSWDSTTDEATLFNAAFQNREIKFNYNGGTNPRFACYTSGQVAIKLYHYVEHALTDFSIESEISVYKSGTHQIVVSYDPADAFDKELTWESANDAIATVSNTGVVTGVAVGQVIITASKTIGGNPVVRQCEVTVLNNVSTHRGTAADPFDIADAVEVAKGILVEDPDGEPIDLESEYYVKGMVTAAVTRTTSKVTLWLGDNASQTTAQTGGFEVYQSNKIYGQTIGTFYDGKADKDVAADFALNQIIIVKSKLTVYGGTPETANGESDIIYAEYIEARNYAEAFNSAFEAVCKEDDDSETYVTLLNTTWGTQSGLFAALDDGVKAILSGAEGSTKASATAIEKCAAKYDYIGGKYQTRLGGEFDFMGRNPTPNNSEIVFGQFAEEDNNSMIYIIAAIAVTSVMSLSVLLVLRKRKQR